MTKLFDTALPPLWYVAMWLCGVIALYFAIRFGIRDGWRDAQQATKNQQVSCDNPHGEVRG